MLLFGFGDGGGGPNVDMMEKLRRLSGAATPTAVGTAVGAAVGAEMGGGASGEIPAMTVEGPSEFFRGLEANARDLMTWQV